MRDIILYGNYVENNTYFLQAFVPHKVYSLKRFDKIMSASIVTQPFLN